MPRVKKASKARKASSRKAKSSVRKRASSSKKKVTYAVVKPKASRRKTKSKSKAAVPPSLLKRSHFLQGGEFLGGLVGMPSIGRSAGSLLSKITGHGDYTVEANSILHGSQIPQFAGRHGYRIRHREFIGNVLSSVNFFNTSYPINPGLSQTFPWLSSVAANFEEYKWHGLVFEFRTTSGTSVGSTNTSLGTVCAATEYNATLPAFSSKVQMLNYEFSSSSAACDNLLHPVECKKNENVLSELYVRTSGLPSGSDIRMYDQGIFQLATVGMQADNNTIGELWVSFDVEFFKPKIGYSSQSLWQGHVTATTGISTSAYFGTDTTNKTTNSGIISCGSVAFVLPSDVPLGRYLITYQVTGTTTASVAPPGITYTSNCAAANILVGSTTGYLQSNTASSTRTFFTAFVDVTGPSPTFTFSGATLPTSATGMDLVVTQISSKLT